MSRKFLSQFIDSKGVVVADNRGNGLVATGSGAPTNSLTGYAIGCVYARSDGGAGTAIYINEGTASSSTWVALGNASLTSLTVTTLTAGTLVNVTGTRSAGAATDTYKANTAAALTITDGSTSILVVDTRNTIANVSNVTITGAAPTIASAAAAHINSSLNVAPKTITYSGTNTVTSSLGAQLYLDIPTFTDASAGTVTTVSTMHVAAVATAGGSLTLTNRRMISTGVSDCFLTNAGVWTDTACWSWGKKNITDPSLELIDKVMGQLAPRSWQYTSEHHGDDRGRERVGLVYDDLPEELRAPGEEKAVSVGLLTSFALAALKTLWDRNQKLEERLEALEAV